MDRGSIEISTFAPTLAPEAAVASDRNGVGVEPVTARSVTSDDALSPKLPVCSPSDADRASPSIGARSVIGPAGSGDRANLTCAPDRRFVSSPACRARERFSGRRVATAATGACISIALHALLLSSILWSDGSPEHHPRDAGALNAVTPEASEDGALQVILIQEESSSPPAAQALSSAVRPRPSALEEITVSDALAKQAMPVPDFSADLTGSAATAAPDAALRSALYGRYVGQIDARIERAWRRPRTAIGAPLFACLVRIDQDSRGTVLEVTLEQCNGTADWQQSIVTAVEAASPLPAPPDPKVFTRILHLSFHSAAYSSEAPQDSYERFPAAQRLARISAESENSRALDDFARELRAPSSHKVISLTLGGGPAASAPAARSSTPLPASSASAPLPARAPAE